MDCDNRMLLLGELWKHLAEIDAAYHERMDFLIPAMARQEGVTETLKAADQMAWVGLVNNCKIRIEEIIFEELVYN